MTNDGKDTKPVTTLQVPTVETVREELKVEAPLVAKDDLEGKANAFVDALLATDPSQQDALAAKREAAEKFGAEEQKQAARHSAMLREPIKKLSTRGADGGPVANALLDLKMKVEELDPGKFDFEPGWFSRTLGRLPGVGTPIKRYFSRFESAQTVLAAIVRSLEEGKEQLLRDNVTLGEDQKNMRESSKRLQASIELARLVETKIAYRLEREIPADDPRHKFLAEEILFPLRQRILDLQQQLAVSQQGVVAIEILVRNNKELARGVDRALRVTMSALETGVTVALGLANQRIVLDKVQAASKTADDLIAGTAKRLRTQGVEIQKQAATTQLDVGVLKTAFTDLEAALEDLSTFRQQALPQLASTIGELDQITQAAEKTIQKMESARKAEKTPALQS